MNIIIIKNKERVVRFIISTLSIIMLLVGIVTLLSPIPFGLIIIAVSLSLLITVNVTAQKMVIDIRKKNMPVNRFLLKIENRTYLRVPFIDNALLKTRPKE